MRKRTAKYSSLREDDEGAYITVYHGTHNKHADSIRQNGLLARYGNYDEPGWYMVATDMESALYHATPGDADEYAIVFEFRVPTSPDAFWEGYPYLWVAYERTAESSWYALKMPLPVDFIVSEHRVDRSVWRERKDLKY